ncbi:MAG: hypothetical protein ACYC35_07070 [Pirellulales bacterium]
MAVQLATSSVVVAAHHFNPSVTGQHWLLTNGIVLEEELQVGAVFTDVVVQVPTRDFHLLVTPESCQLSFVSQVAMARQQQLITDRLARLVSLLPHTPYTAVGLNFVWHYFPDNETISAACRRLFFSKGKTLHQVFDKGDARFGAYLSMDWGGYRLRLDARPVVQTLPDGQANDVMQFAFNYHQEVAGRPDAAARIAGAVGHWHAAQAHALSILQGSLGEGTAA